MELQSIIKELKEAGSQRSQDFLKVYLKYENEIISNLNAFSGIKSDIYLRDINSHDKHIKLSSIFSDFTSVYAGSSTNSSMHITFFKEGSPYNYDRELTIPLSLSNEIKPDSNMQPGYMYNNNTDVKKLFKKVDYLMENQRLMVRPIRVLWVDNFKREKESLIYYAEGNTDLKHWVIRDKYYDENSIPIETSLDPLNLKTLFEITLPYFENTSLENFSKIITEESDLLSSFRVELKSLVKQALEDTSKIEEIKNDIIRPRIDTINRKFSSLKERHRLTIAGDIVFFTISLFTLNSIPGTPIQDILKALISGGGIAGKLLFNEVKYKKETEPLKDDPLFLLWKIEKAKRK